MTSDAESRRGLQNPAVVDLVFEDVKSGKFILVMIESRDWSGSHEQFEELKKKLDAYLAFALGGELAKKYPDSVGKKVRIDLVSFSEPGTEIREFLQGIRKRLEEYEVEFNVVVRLKLPS